MLLISRILTTAAAFSENMSVLLRVITFGYLMDQFLQSTKKWYFHSHLLPSVKHSAATTLSKGNDTETWQNPQPSGMKSFLHGTISRWRTPENFICLPLIRSYWGQIDTVCWCSSAGNSSRSISSSPEGCGLCRVSVSLYLERDVAVDFFPEYIYLIWFGLTSVYK